MATKAHKILGVSDFIHYSSASSHARVRWLVVASDSICKGAMEVIDLTKVLPKYHVHFSAPTDAN